MNYTLGFEGISGVPFEKYEKNFTFIVNGQEIKTNRIVADFLSPIIKSYHFTDSSITSFRIEIPKESNDDQEESNKTIPQHFEDFLTLLNFDSHLLTKTQLKYYLQFFHELGNINEYFKLQPDLFTNLNTQNAISILQSINQMKEKTPFIGTSPFVDQTYNKILEFISTNFCHFSKENLNGLTNEELHAIFSSNALKKSDENAFFELIFSLYNEDHERAFLFHFVAFEDLRWESMNKFTNEFNFEDLDHTLWETICSMIFIKPKFTIKSFKLNDQNKFSGILKYLSDETKGNVLDNGTVGITSTSVHQDHPLRNLVTFTKDNYFRSGDDIQTICFDFKEKKIQITNYSIQTGTDGTNNGHLKNWSIEVSNDGNEWKEIDHQENVSSLNGNKYSASFNVAHQNNGFYQFVRLRQIGYPWRGSSYYIEIMYIEFFGQLMIPPTK